MFGQFATSGTKAQPSIGSRSLRACLVHFPTQPGSHQPARPPLARLSACRCVCLVAWLSAAWTHAAGVWFLEPVSDSNCEDAGTMFGCLHRSWSSYHFVWVVRLPTSLEFSTIIYSRWIYIILKSKVKITKTWINTITPSTKITKTSGPRHKLKNTWSSAGHNIIAHASCLRFRE
jgi:hypothetical protein